MAARTFFLLLALAGSTQAQQFTNLLWPPRDVGVNESFGQFAFALDRDLLAVRDARESENPFVRVYKREGLNWIEDARLSVQPRTPVVASSLGDLLDVDDGRVVTADGNAIQLFKRFGERKWAHEEVPAPAGVQGFGRLVSLSGDWMAAASSDAVHLLHRDPGGWSVAQELAGRIAFQLELSGANLLLTEAKHVRILHFDGSTWAQELDLGFAENSTPASLDGDRLGLVSRQTFRSYDRVGSS